MSEKQYSLIFKMQTLWLLRDMSLEKASASSGVAVSTIRYWKRHEQEIRHAYYLALHEEVNHKLLVAQSRIATKLIDLLNALDSKLIANAPLNQIVSAVGILLDRILKVNDAKEIENNHSPIRFEHYDATTGKVSETPPWAETDSGEGESFYSRLMRETLRQDGISEIVDYANGLRWDEDMVARPNLSDSEPSLAGFEGGADGYDWYHD